jgi:flagellin
VTRPGNDAAGFAIAEGLRGQLSGIKQARYNADTAISMLQVAEGGLNEQNNILIRLRELAVYSASDTLGDTERGFINTEFQQLAEEFDRIAKTTRYGNKELLTGSGEEFEFQIGAYNGAENSVKFKLESDTSGSETGIDGLSIEDQDDALSALDELDTAIGMVAEARSTFGAMQSRLQFASDHLMGQTENIAAARSQIADTDVAEEVSKLAQAQIIQEAAVSVLAQANQDTGRMLRLIG